MANVMLTQYEDWYTMKETRSKAKKASGDGKFFHENYHYCT